MIVAPYGGGYVHAGAPARRGWASPENEKFWSRRSWMKEQMLSMRVATHFVSGVGLIGGSFALALKQAQAVHTPCGRRAQPGKVRHALDRGVID